MRSPTDASPTSSRMPAHGSGPMWFAIPSSRWTCTTYSLPVSRRTDMFSWTLTEAAIRLGDRALAEAFVAERQSWKPQSPVNQAWAMRAQKLKHKLVATADDAGEAQ